MLKRVKLKKMAISTGSTLNVKKISIYGAIRA